jgi:hypothetical protein
VTIAGEELEHRLYHFRLAYSGWSHVKVVLGGESYSALAEGLQEALWRLGGAPLEHRTDSLSAAYKNLSSDAQADLTERYTQLCAHYGMTATRNNRGVSHENGAVESPHGHIKRRIAQALLLRDSVDFASLQDYRQWLDALLVRFNRRCSEALAIERAQLKPCHGGAPATTASRSSSVTTFATIDVKRVLYSVPARLVGERLRLHVFDDRIEAFVGAALALTLPRVYSVNHERARRIDYRHLIGVLARKPQAFRYSQLRDDLLPNATYRTIWQHLDSHLEARAACKRIVGILALAARADCEQALGAYLLERIAARYHPHPDGAGKPFRRRATQPHSRLSCATGPVPSTRSRATTTCCPRRANPWSCTDMVQTATLPLMLKQLNLTSIARHWQTQLETAERNGWDGARYLSALCEQELADRHSRRISRYSKESQLPPGKSLASFDFAELPDATRAQIQALAGSSDWTRQARNLLLFGASGVGKTHLAAAIGHALTERNVRVRYATPPRWCSSCNSPASNCAWKTPCTSSTSTRCSFWTISATSRKASRRRRCCSNSSPIATSAPA